MHKKTGKCFLSEIPRKNLGEISGYEGKSDSPSSNIIADNSFLGWQMRQDV